MKKLRDIKIVIAELNKLKIGTKIKATISFYKKESKEKDQVVNLKKASDGWYIDNGPDELSYNWNIIEFEVINKVKK